MSPAYHHRSTCRLCDCKELTKVFALTPTPPANAFVSKEQLSEEQASFPLDLFFCNKCAHLQLMSFLDPNQLFQNYIYVSGTSKTFIEHFFSYAKSCINRFSLTSDSLVIDIGSNDGTLLSVFKEKHLNVLGIDPARNIAKTASAKGIETWPEFFNHSTVEKILETKGRAAIITANNVFAHIDNLSGLVRSIRSLLKPRGVFVFEVSYLGAVFENTLFDTIYHEHVAYHSIQPLIGFFNSNGMELFDVEKIASHGGSIRGMAQLIGGPNNTNSSVQKMINYEKKLGLNLSKTWVSFANKITLLRDELVTLLTNLKREGKSIAGYGAPAKATTLMYHLGIGPEIIDFISDDSPLKQGLYSPGFHIPILSSDAIYKRNPDYVLLLAWNFTIQIVENHQRYLKIGGHFIVPLPEIRII